MDNNLWGYFLFFSAMLVSKWHHHSIHHQLFIFVQAKESHFFMFQNTM